MMLTSIFKADFDSEYVHIFVPQSNPILPSVLLMFIITPRPFLRAGGSSPSRLCLGISSGVGYGSIRIPLALEGVAEPARNSGNSAVETRAGPATFARIVRRNSGAEKANAWS